MDTFEIIGYASLGVLVLLMVLASFAGMFLSGRGLVIGVLLVVGLGALLIKVFKERLNNTEDDHYSDTVDQ